MSDLNKTLARHKIGNTKWLLARATHSVSRRNFPGQPKLSLGSQDRPGADTADRDRAGGSQTEDTEGELTTEVTTEVSSQTRHLVTVIRDCEEITLLWTVN